jgi:hypothetical protein
MSIAALLYLPSLACCWESDFHDGLTKWLALKAGYTQDESNTLAYYDEQLDEGAQSAVDSVFHYACIGSDLGVSREVRRHHFPSKAVIPGDPPSRMVVKDSAAVEEEIERHIDKPDKGDWRFELESFGELLHALQDSWSHQGEPDIPGISYLHLSCNEKLAWGHPKARGGWRRHDADHTEMATRRIGSGCGNVLEPTTAATE